ncbi:PAAR domain-containing protein [Aggregatibacter actinomycetemcomitans]|nr:PAAR domain-containing protein [Aggregatibacter actinomycetemcomitans]
MTDNNILPSQEKIEQPSENNSAKVLCWTITPKGKNPAYVGDSVIHPDGSVGIIVGGASNVSFGKRAAACIGDKVECPGHTGVIVQGAKSISIGGKSLAREGDKTSCGGTIMAGYPTITAFDRTRTVHGKSEEKNTREIRFKLAQSAHSNESAYSNMPYTVYVDSAEIDKGITDQDGELVLEVKEDMKECEIKFANGKSYLLSIVEEFEDGTDKDKIAPKGFPIYDDLGVDYAKSYENLVSGEHNKE